MVEREEARVEGRRNRGLASVVLGLAGLAAAAFVAFLVYYTLIAPERVADPTDVFDPETPSEGVSVPDGGDLTGMPTQTPPNSPSRTVLETQ